MKKKINIEKYIFRELLLINKKYQKIEKKTNFFEEGVDSLDFFSLIFKIEKKFQIKISSKRYNGLNSVKKLTDFVKKSSKL